jgi:ubiquitin carboxyl-terminal hydrolase 9/24
VKEMGDIQVDEAVLEGHLGIAKELLSFMSPEKKYELGSEEKKGINLIKVLCKSYTLCRNFKTEESLFSEITNISE